MPAEKRDVDELVDSTAKLLSCEFPPNRPNDCDRQNIYDWYLSLGRSPRKLEFIQQLQSVCGVNDLLIKKAMRGASFRSTNSSASAEPTPTSSAK